MAFEKLDSGLLIPVSSASSKQEQFADFSKLMIWAENGFVKMERPPEPDKEGDDGEYVVLSIKSARERFKRMGELFNRFNKKNKGNPWWRDVKASFEDALKRFEAAIAKAEEQGPYEYEDMQRMRADRLPKSISVPTNVPKLKVKGRG